jgi:predicted patatin/cPLA2 family phospholipase
MSKRSRLPWDTSHETLQVMHRRRRDDSKPGARAADDHARVALLVDGGGMRGVISAAMLSALDDLGYKDAVDVVYGYSAGAVNAAYFIAGEMWYPLSIYYDHLASTSFVDFKRSLRRQPIMSLSFASEVVVGELKPLDYNAVRNSALPLVVAITMVDTMRGELARDFRSNQDLKEAIVASCWLPLATVGTASFRGRPAIDGGVLMPSMLEAAENDGCTHVLLLRTVPLGNRPKRRGLLFRNVASRYLDRLEPGLGAAYAQAWADLSSRAERRREARALQVGLLPQHAALPMHEMDPAKLLRAARDAYGSMYAMLEKIPLTDVLDGLVDVVPRLTVRLKVRATQPQTTARTPANGQQRAGQLPPERLKQTDATG